MADGTGHQVSGARLLWSSRSPFARKVTACAHELGLTAEIELVPVTVATPVVNLDVSRHNPLSKIPTLVLEDGTALLDSGVICEFLDATAGNKLIPQVSAARWRALTIQAIADGLLDALILWRNELARTAPVENIATALRTKCEQALDRLNQEAAALNADAPGISELATGCALGYLDFRFASFGWRDHRPALAAFYRALSQRPSFVATEHRDH